MVDYRTLYYQTVAAAANAVDALDKQNFGDARAILIAAMQTAEEAVISSEDSCQITVLPSHPQDEGTYRAARAQKISVQIAPLSLRGGHSPTWQSVILCCSNGNTDCHRRCGAYLAMTRFSMVRDGRPHGAAPTKRLHIKRAAAVCSGS